MTTLFTQKDTTWGTVFYMPGVVRAASLESRWGRTWAPRVVALAGEARSGPIAMPFCGAHSRASRHQKEAAGCSGLPWSLKSGMRPADSQMVQSNPPGRRGLGVDL